MPIGIGTRLSCWNSLHYSSGIGRIFPDGRGSLDTPVLQWQGFILVHGVASECMDRA